MEPRARLGREPRALRPQEQGEAEGQAFTMETKNLKRGAPPAATFEIPAGYTVEDPQKNVAQSFAASLMAAFDPTGFASMAIAAEQTRQQQVEAAAVRATCKPMNFQ